MSDDDGGFIDFFGDEGWFNDFDDVSDSTASFFDTNTSLISDPGPDETFLSPRPAPIMTMAPPINPIPIRQVPLYNTMPAPIGYRPVFQRNERNQLPNLDVFQTHRKTRTVQPWTSATPVAARTDQIFFEYCTDNRILFNPRQLKFEPSFYWPDRNFTFGDLVYDFFRRKNNQNARFSHKLYNALCIAATDPFYAELVGVRAITPNIIRVNKGAFARLLAIKTIDGSLFHQQGNFSTHNFFEMSREQVQMYCQGMDIGEVDFDEVRMMYNPVGPFFPMCGTPFH